MEPQDHLSRRGFIQKAALMAAASTITPLWASESEAYRSFPQEKSMGDEFLVEARYYDKLPHRKIKCHLCPRECEIDDLERGYCGVRENRSGTYYTLVHSRPCTWHVDPIEKKPLFHFLPGTDAFSIATVGCNIECKFCQNWQISQIRPEQSLDYIMPPEMVAQAARESGSRTIAYTYTEPVIFYEYMYDCAVAGRERGVKSVMISNGYIMPEPMKALCKQLDAVKIDLKAFTERFYNMQMGRLKPVLDTLELLRDAGIWYEIVYLVIPTLNDDPDELKAMCRWVYAELGPDVPVHFSRFYPQYKLRNLPPTPIKTVEMARKIALDSGLHYAYVGNVPPGHGGEHTYCPNCGKVVIRRSIYVVSEIHIRDGKCRFCGHPIPGVWG